VFGRVTYRDTFQRERFTNFSYGIHAWPKRGAPIWHNMVRHNDSD
jgi:hypothetical protein